MPFTSAIKPMENRMSDQDGEPVAVRRKRLRFRAWHRGTKEMDLLMGPFADDRIENLDADRLAEFEALLSEPEPDVYGWITGTAAVPMRLRGTVLDQIIAYHADKHA
jgi:antitoxin CptB